MKQFCKNCIYKALPYYERDYLANKMVFLEGDALDLVYRIEEGYVKMHRYLESGDEKILSILGPGDYIALLAVLQGENEYIASAMTLTKTRLQAMDKDQVIKAYSSNAIFKDNCISCAITRTNFFQFQITQSGNTDTKERIVNILKNLQKKFGEPLNPHKTIKLPFTKTVLANIIGIRRETLSRHLTELQEEKILKIEKNTYIFL